MNRSRRGSLIGATWLIGLGVVFLIQQASGWSWSEAWPLFVVLVGIASAVSVLAGRDPGWDSAWALTWPVIWTVVGILVLAGTTGRISLRPAELFAQWWPWALVGLGVWYVVGAFVPVSPAAEELSVPLNGLHQARLELKFGAGELTTHRAAPGSLIDGRFAGGVRRHQDGPATLQLSQDSASGVPWIDHDARWDVGLTGEIPLDLRLETGANRGRLDLSELLVTNLELHTGASDTWIRLPRAAGSTAVRTESGASSVTIEVPAGVAARIRSNLTIGTSHIDPALFPRVGDVFQSPDYDRAANRVDVDINGGLGRLTVVGCR